MSKEYRELGRAELDQIVGDELPALYADAQQHTPIVQTGF
jgi:hypothetical protein